MTRWLEIIATSCTVLPGRILPVSLGDLVCEHVDISQHPFHRMTEDVGIHHVRALDGDDLFLQQAPCKPPSWGSPYSEWGGICTSLQPDSPLTTTTPEVNFHSLSHAEALSITIEASRQRPSREPAPGGPNVVEVIRTSQVLLPHPLRTPIDSCVHACLIAAQMA